MPHDKQAAKIRWLIPVIIVIGVIGYLNILLAIGAVLLTGGIFMVWSGICRRSPLLIAAGIGLPLLTASVLLLLFALAMHSFIPSPTTDLRQYNKLMEQASSNLLTDHFPRSIPTDARNVQIDAKSAQIKKNQQVIELINE